MCHNMLSCSIMLIFEMDEYTIITSPGVERISTPVEHKASVMEFLDSMSSLCEETGNRHPQPA